MSSSFSLLGRHCSKEIGRKESPTSKNYGKTEAMMVKTEESEWRPQREN